MFADTQIGPLLGQGGFGRVYKAMHHGVECACKVSLQAISATYQHSG